MPPAAMTGHGDGSALGGSGGRGIVPGMRASEIRDLIRVKPVELDATRRRLSSCHDIADLRATGTSWWSAARLAELPLPAGKLVASSSGPDVASRVVW